MPPDIRLGLIGAGSRGRYLIQKCSGVPGAAWVAVCDAWPRRCGEAEHVAGRHLAAYTDYRQLLDRRDIDAIVIATLDHWHAQMTVDACAAGKDVYVEKPMTATPEEGHLIAEAASRSRRIVQVGMQQRSAALFHRARQLFFESGRIGAVHMVRLWWNANRYYGPFQPPPDLKLPSGLDWQAWLGRYAGRPWDPHLFYAPLLHSDFSTGGQIGGLLVHMIDVVHWYLNLCRPRSAVALGGIYQYHDGRDTPDNINAILAYPEGVNISFEASVTDGIQQDAANMIFMGAGGRLSIFRKGYNFLPADGGPPERLSAPGSGIEEHFRNWIDCIRSRSLPNATVAHGHYSSVVCHMANMAYRSGNRIDWRESWDLKG